MAQIGPYRFTFGFWEGTVKFPIGSFNESWTAVAMLLLMNAFRWSSGAILDGNTLLNRSRKRSAFSFGQFVVLPLYVIGIPSGDRLDPLPSMLLVNDHKRDWSLGPRFEMKEDQASFLSAMMYLFLMASAFFHSVRRVSDVGDLHHFFSAVRAFFTRVWHLASHHGRVGSELLERAGLDFLKNFPLALFIPVRNDGDTISRNFKSVLPGRS